MEKLTCPLNLCNLYSFLFIPQLAHESHKIVPWPKFVHQNGKGEFSESGPQANSGGEAGRVPSPSLRVRKPGLWELSLLGPELLGCDQASEAGPAACSGVQVECWVPVGVPVLLASHWDGAKDTGHCPQ